MPISVKGFSTVLTGFLLFMARLVLHVLCEQCCLVLPMADALPRCVTQTVVDKSSTYFDSVPDALDAVVNASGTIVDVFRVLPHFASLPAGLRLTSVNKNDLKSLPVIEDDTHASKLQSNVTVRFRTATLVSDEPSTLPDGIRQAELVLADDQVLTGQQYSVGDLPMNQEGHAHSVEFFQKFPGEQDQTGPTSVNISVGDHRTLCHLVSIDAIAYVARSATDLIVKNAVAQAVERQLCAIRALLNSCPQLPRSRSETAVLVTHFPVLCDSAVLSLVSLSDSANCDEAESASVKARELLHHQLLLPMDKPLFRRSCAIDAAGDKPACALIQFREDGGCVGRLADVHIGIKSHGLGENGVTVRTVRGKYLYCHYLQDRFNDSRWGCAYRSLQTLMSWCALNGWTQLPHGVLPSHKDIQRALVAIGDKPDKFVGSREWIGANEVCYALHHFTGIDSKILHVTRGSEMESHGREVVRHFEQQGSPVMVGGGSLAWTILGVARDSRTGKTRFLILDPHYEGKDDLKVIQNKGWIGWKAANIFASNSFYNLCMPMRPPII